MAIDGVGGNNQADKKYTMEKFGINFGTPEVSLFNCIDKLDGQQDGYLTEEQATILTDILSARNIIIGKLEELIQEIKREKTKIDVQTELTIGYTPKEKKEPKKGKGIVINNDININIKY